MATNSSLGSWSSHENGVAPEFGEELGGGGSADRVEMSDGKTGEIYMRIGKYVCPTRHVNDFTPLEFEEVTCRLWKC